MDVVCLRSFPELPIVSPVNHTTMHRNCIVENLLDHAISIGALQGRNTSFGQSEIDGLGKVQWDRSRVAKICKLLHNVSKNIRNQHP